jgi:PEP-CTERM motif-containing protein
MADGLQFLGNRWDTSPSLVMPTSYDGPLNDPGYLGGNLLIGASTPEPSSTGLIMLGLFAILVGVAWRPRKRYGEL